MVRVSGISFRSASPAYIQLGYFKNRPKVEPSCNPIKVSETKSTKTPFGISVINFIKYIANI